MFSGDVTLAWNYVIFEHLLCRYKKRSTDCLLSHNMAMYFDIQATQNSRQQRHTERYHNAKHNTQHTHTHIRGYRLHPRPTTMSRRADAVSSFPAPAAANALGRITEEVPHEQHLHGQHGHHHQHLQQRPAVHQRQVQLGHAAATGLQQS